MIIFMIYSTKNSENTTRICNVLNNVFFVIFVAEAVLKVSCMGKSYFKDNYNKFDFFIVTLTLTTNILEWVKLIKNFR